MSSTLQGHRTKLDKNSSEQLHSATFTETKPSGLILPKTSSVATGFGRHGMPPRRPSVILTFDRLTLKLVCESHLRWGTFLSNLGMLSL